MNWRPGLGNLVVGEQADKRGRKASCAASVSLYNRDFLKRVRIIIFANSIYQAGHLRLKRLYFIQAVTSSVDRQYNMACLRSLARQCGKRLPGKDSDFTIAKLP